MAKGKYENWLASEGLVRLEGWARDGLTDEQIAKNIGISRSTLSMWKIKFPEFADSLKKGKEVVDREVENALLKRALGYKCTETRTVISEKDGKKTEITIKEVIPSTTAQIFWLKNRKPGTWRDDPEVKNEEAIKKLDEILDNMKTVAEKGGERDEQE